MITQKVFFEKYSISEAQFRKTKLKWKDLEDIYHDFESKRFEFEPTAEDITGRLLKIPKVHSVRYRIKDSEHLIEKIIRKSIKDKKRKYTINDYISKIDDIIGVRALHLFKEDWEEIDKYIKSTWEMNEAPTANVRHGDSKGLEQKFRENGFEINPHDYGYRSIHYIIKSSPTKQTFKAELQVRTIFEEGWSEIDHSIRYPYDLENPILKQYLLIFNRLAGSADEMGSYIKFLQLELLKKENTYNERIAERDQIIANLKAKINQLSIDQKSKNEIGSSLEQLISITPNVFTSSTSNFQQLQAGFNPINSTIQNSLTADIVTNSIFTNNTCIRCGATLQRGDSSLIYCKKCDHDEYNNKVDND